METKNEKKLSNVMLFLPLHVRFEYDGVKGVTGHSLLVDAESLEDEKLYKTNINLFELSNAKEVYIDNVKFEEKIRPYSIPKKSRIERGKNDDAKYLSSEYFFFNNYGTYFHNLDLDIEGDSYFKTIFDTKNKDTKLAREYHGHEFYTPTFMTLTIINQLLYLVFNAVSNQNSVVEGEKDFDQIFVKNYKYLGNLIDHLISKTQYYFNSFYLLPIESTDIELEGYEKIWYQHYQGVEVLSTQELIDKEYISKRVGESLGMDLRWALCLLTPEDKRAIAKFMTYTMLILYSQIGETKHSIFAKRLFDIFNKNNEMIRYLTPFNTSYYREVISSDFIPTSLDYRYDKRIRNDIDLKMLYYQYNQMVMNHAKLNIPIISLQDFCLWGVDGLNVYDPDKNDDYDPDGGNHHIYVRTFEDLSKIVDKILKLEDKDKYKILTGRDIINSETRFEFKVADIYLFKLFSYLNGHIDYIYYLERLSKQVEGKTVEQFKTNLDIDTYLAVNFGIYMRSVFITYYFTLVGEKSLESLLIRSNKFKDAKESEEKQVKISGVTAKTLADSKE